MEIGATSSPSLEAGELSMPFGCVGREARWAKSHFGRLAWRWAPCAAVVLQLGTYSTALAQGARTRDSAGVIIVQNGEMSTARPVFSIAPKPVRKFGGTQEDERYELSLGAIFDIIALPNREVGVLNGNDIKIFDDGGKYLRSLGRKGGGPREFQTAVREICIAPGGRGLAIESTAPRAGVLSPKNELVGTITYPGMATYGGCLGDGRFVSILERLPGTGQSGPMGRFGVIDFNGRLVGELGQLPVGGQASLLPTEVSVVGHAGNVYVGDGRKFEYRVYDANGKLHRIVRTSDRLLPFRQSDAEAVMTMRLPRGIPANAKEEVLGQMRSIPRPAYWPAYSRLVVDPAGRVWLSDPPRSPSVPASWAVFDPKGFLLGRVTLAEHPLAKTQDFFRIVRWLDSTVVVLYRDKEGSPVVSELSLLPLPNARPNKR